MKSLIACIAIALLVSGCARRNMVYRNPVDDVRDISYREVNLYAWQTREYIANNNEEKAKEVMLERVKTTLKDPESARFRNVRLVDYAEGKLFCGEVNAKNSYGGYVGFKPFVASPYEATLQKESTRYPHITEAENAGIVDACINR